MQLERDASNLSARLINELGHEWTDRLASHITAPDAAPRTAASDELEVTSCQFGFETRQGDIVLTGNMHDRIGADLFPGHL